MAAIPNGMPTPNPIAVGRLAECSGVWAGTEESVYVMAGEDAGTIVAFVSVVPEEKMVVTRSLGFLVATDCETVTGGNPSSKAFVRL